MSREMQSKRGGNFRELVAAMRPENRARFHNSFGFESMKSTKSRPGDYSDIATSSDGLHLLQRIA